MVTSEITKAIACLETALGALREVPNARDAEELRDALASAQGCIASAASSVFAVQAAARSPLPPTETHHTICPACPACQELVAVAVERDGRTLPPPLLYCPGCGHRWAASAEERALAEGADAAWAALVGATR
jgi:heterodisulfide reductase subunit A-like polyferredoxin